MKKYLITVFFLLMISGFVFAQNILASDFRYMGNVPGGIGLYHQIDGTRIEMGGGPFRDCALDWAGSFLLIEFQKHVKRNQRSFEPYDVYLYVGVNKDSEGYSTMWHIWLYIDKDFNQTRYSYMIKSGKW